MHWKLFVLCEELHWGFFFFRNKVLKRHHRMFAYLSPFCSLFLKITSYRKNSLNAIALIQILKSTTRIHKFVMNIIFQWTLYMYFELHVLRWHIMHDVPILEFKTPELSSHSQTLDREGKVWRGLEPSFLVGLIKVCRIQLEMLFQEWR